MTAPTLFSLLQQLEAELRACGAWQSQAPDEAALQSSQPFALDTLAPHEWLQWIFVPRLQQMIASGQPLPRGFAITPYFEQAWLEQTQFGTVMTILYQIDEACR